MKLLIAIVLSCLPTVAEEQPIPNPRQLKTFKEIRDSAWLSFSAMMNNWHGDYWDYGPAVVLQRSPDGTVVVSWSGGPEAEQVPIVSKIVSRTEGEALRSELLELYRKGLHEVAEVEKMTEKEISDYTDKTGHTPSYVELEI